MSADPLQLFDEWLAEARAGEAELAEAMTLATADETGRPAARIVLLKGHGPAGFIFYTNQRSRKGDELAENPRAALLFHWKSLRRQVRIEGPVSIVSDAEADDYFASRSRDSQLGAWASDQSRPLPNEAELEKRYEEIRDKFDGQDVPRLSHWGGYRVAAETIEFWTERPHRLHQRRLFTHGADGWSEGLLYP
jgi:pyridoxamine 5'-phosphate oxidase